MSVLPTTCQLATASGPHNGSLAPSDVLAANITLLLFSPMPHPTPQPHHHQGC
jgi:hypothetical protein